MTPSAAFGLQPDAVAAIGGRMRPSFTAHSGILPVSTLSRRRTTSS